jgi:hypothetical protein
MPTQNQALMEAYASAPPSQRIYETLEIDHPSFAEPAYIVANVGSDQEFGIEAGAAHNAGSMVLFLACPLKSPWPEQREGQPPSATVEIDNVSRELMPKIRAALGIRAYITVIFRQYLDSDLTEPAFGPIEYILKDVVATGTKLSGMVMVKNLSNKRFPALTKNYSYTQFPSLLP